MTTDLMELIEEKLTQQHSNPDQISAHLAKYSVALISHEPSSACLKDNKDESTLIFTCFTAAKNTQAQVQEFGARTLPNRVDIDQRPPIVAAKSRIGDWESHTIIGANH